MAETTTQVRQDLLGRRGQTVTLQRLLDASVSGTVSGVSLDAVDLRLENGKRQTVSLSSVLSVSDVTDSGWFCGLCDRETAKGVRVCTRCTRTARRA